MKHARNSASSAYRWMNCPGSIKLSEKCPAPKSSPYAEEGTRAHDFAEKMLQCYYDDTATMDKVNTSLDSARATKEMAEAVVVYFDTITEQATYTEVKDKEKFVFIENKFSLEFLFPEMFGTNDCCVFDPKKKKLTVYDYKHGAGIVVNPKRNSQLMFYGLGAAYSLWQRFGADVTQEITDLIETVELVIVQPRAEHADGPIRRWEISCKDLFFWGVNVLRPSAIATTEDNARLQVGGHCRFCPALAVCPAQIEHACAVAKVDFERPVFPAPDALTENDIAKVLDASSMFSKWAKDVTEYAQERIKLGSMEVPGYKLVAKRVLRKWKDEQKVEEILLSYLGDNAHVRKLLSPAQAEKELKKMDVTPEYILDGLIDKPEGGVCIAKDTDRRKEVAPKSQSDFIERMDFLK